jgi:hypothetical protein
MAQKTMDTDKLSLFIEKLSKQLGKIFYFHFTSLLLVESYDISCNTILTASANLN